MRNTILGLMLMMASIGGKAQEGVTTFGFQFKPIIPVDYFNAGPVEAKNGFFRTRFEPKFGTHFGMVIRWGFTKNLSLETGISHVRRNYNVFNYNDSIALEDKSDVALIAYEIPLNGLVFVRLNEDWYLNTAVGTSFSFFPSSVKSYGQDRSFYQISRRKFWTLMALNVNFGAEYRSYESGIFYIGASFHRPFAPITETTAMYDYNNNIYEADTKLNGSYITIDFRYFFHEDKE